MLQEDIDPDDDWSWDGLQGDASPWFIGHIDSKKMEMEVLSEYVETAKGRGLVDLDNEERYEYFANYLKSQGYTLFQTAGYGDAFIVHLNAED